MRLGGRGGGGGGGNSESLELPLDRNQSRYDEKYGELQ